MEIYGNKNVTDRIDFMFSSGRLSHSFLLYGEKGLGKKTLAKYIAMRLLCESDKSPCGDCYQCRNIINNTHPDVIIVEHTGKTNSISADTVRRICSEASVKPNYSKKILLFLDADSMNSTSQNILLKSIEEPPEYAYYIFTARAKDTFLPTILSRVVSIGVTECSDKECIEALTSLDYPPEQIQSAIECFHGNIGNCLEYLNQGELYTSVEIVRRFTKALLNHDEYQLLRVFTELNGNKSLTKQTLYIMDKHIRDIIAVKLGCTSNIGCDFEGAKLLSEKISVKACQSIHLLIYEAFNDIENNANMNLVLAALCSNIITNS